jgi:hypothetical protein
MISTEKELLLFTTNLFFGVFLPFRLKILQIFQFVCPNPKGSKLKNKPVPFRDSGQKQVDFLTCQS